MNKDGDRAVFLALQDLIAFLKYVAFERQWGAEYDGPVFEEKNKKLKAALEWCRENSVSLSPETLTLGQECAARAQAFTAQLKGEMTHIQKNLTSVKTRSKCLESYAQWEKGP